MKKLLLILLLFLSLVSFGTTKDSTFTTVGTFSFVVPDSVVSISTFAVQGGQGAGYLYGGSGGSIAFGTGIMVTPLTIILCVPPE